MINLTKKEKESIDLIQVVCEEYYRYGLELPLSLDIRLIELGFDPVFLEEVYIKSYCFYCSYCGGCTISRNVFG